MDDQRCRLDEPQNGDGGEGAADSMPSLNEMIGELVFPLILPYVCCLKQVLNLMHIILATSRLRSLHNHIPTDRGAV